MRRFIIVDEFQDDGYGVAGQPINELITSIADASSGNMTGSSVVRAVDSPARRTLTFTGHPQAL